MHKILIVEDVEVVADLQILMLIRAGIAFEARRVETVEDFTRQIGFAVPDAILYSASMPQFSGFVALAKAQSLCPDTPFIFVSGTHSKETAAETRKRATIDCVFTTSLAELPTTFDRAIKEAEERKNYTLPLPDRLPVGLPSPEQHRERQRHPAQRQTRPCGRRAVP